MIPTYKDRNSCRQCSSRLFLRESNDLYSNAIITLLLRTIFGTSFGGDLRSSLRSILYGGGGYS
ncbi:hypothetical protein PISMIDRAFT_686430 [Pisolithus microcarpus 441]|uniref:Uncharacterized protein n=1 Tax=Pisolithus microcarpus 441 TaxID=765257 RepID=A0A0C9YHV0_9AGAM|nr:hypothetical protein PISMIDRAFT_686430 [Pisolithus microcarpus 441]